MIIQHNMASMAAERYNINNNKSRLKSLEKLSSGYRINRSADDAAGLSISEKMRAQIRGLTRAADNVQDGISYAQVADGALSQVSEMLHRMHELAVQSANDTNTPEDRAALDEEVQTLKDEMDRIFTDTEFNTIPIWDTNTEDRIQIGTEKKQAVTIQSFSTQSQTTVTNTNKGAIANGYYRINVQGEDPADASSYGFTVEWTGWDGNDYSTKLISWDDVGVGENTSFGMNLKDYLDLDNYPKTESIAAQIGWRMEETATVADVAASIDGVGFWSSVDSSERISLTTSSSGVSFSVNTNYLAELASGRDVENYDTTWIQPESGVTTPNVVVPTNDSEGWEINFNMPNIGDVVAKSSSLYYYDSDGDVEDEGKWWKWDHYTDGRPYKSTIFKHPDNNDGSLGSVTSVITAAGKSLTEDADGGQIILSFYIDTKDGSKYSYENAESSSSRVGSITMSIKVNDGDTVDSLTNRIQDALNNTTIVDIFAGYENNNGTTTPQSATHYFYYDSNSKANTHEIDVPVYKATLDLAIQAGANTEQAIHMVYDSLRTHNLGIADSSVTTAQEAAKTISAAQEALNIVSEQRSLFGAYQNRFEYTLKQNKNTAENLQAAESRIRDADMAFEAMENAKISLLEQASQAMLANANRQPESVLQLLNS